MIIEVVNNEGSKFLLHEVSSIEEYLSTAYVHEVAYFGRLVSIHQPTISTAIYVIGLD